MKHFFQRTACLTGAALLSAQTAFAAPLTMLRTEYERYQQSLPLLERDKLIAEPGLLALAGVLAVYLVWKLRRDIRKSREEDQKYREMVAEAERLQAEEDARIAQEQAAAPEPETDTQL